MKHTREVASLLTRISGSEAFLLAAVPFAGTCLSLVFEAGYLSFYDVPISVVQIDLIRIVTSTAIVTTFFVGLFMALLFVASVSAGTHPVRKALLEPLLVTLFCAVVVNFMPGNLTPWLAVLAAVAVFLTLVLARFLSPMFSRGDGGTYLERLKKETESENQALTGKENSPTEYLGAFAAFLFGVALVFLIGRNHAEGKVEYWTISDYPNRVVVEIYGDTVVLKSYDPTTKLIGEELTLLRRGDINALTFSRSLIGPLVSPTPRPNGPGG